MDTTTTDFKVSTATGHLFNALRSVEAARSFLYAYDVELFGEDTADSLRDKYDPALDVARDLVEQMLGDSLRTWANTTTPNTPL